MRSQISAELNLSWQQGLITPEATLFTIQLPVISFLKLLIVSKHFLFLKGEGCFQFVTRVNFWFMALVIR